MSEISDPDPPDRLDRSRIGFKVLFGAILCFGLIFRIVGLQHGKPDMIYHPDVSKQAQVARKLFGGGVPLYDFYKQRMELAMYPYGAAVLASSAHKMVLPLSGKSEEDILEKNTWYWARTLRVLSALAGWALGLIAGFVLWRRIGSLAACIGAALLLFEPIGAQFAHYGMNDIPLAAAMTGVWGLSFLMISLGGWKRSLVAGLAGALLGCAFAIKYQAVYGVVFPLAAAGWVAKHEQWRPALVLLVMIGVGGAVGTWMCCYNLSSDPYYFVQNIIPFMKWQTSVVGSEGSWGERVSVNALWLLRFVWREGLLLLLPAAVVAFRGVRSLTPLTRCFFWSGLMFAGLMVLTLVLARELMRENDFLVIYPFLLLPLCISMCVAMRNGIRGRLQQLALLCFAVLALVWAGRTASDAVALEREDTRVRAFEWCLENVPEGSVVFREYYTPKLAMKGVNEIRGRFLADRRFRLPIEQGETDYVMISSLAYDRFTDPYQPYYDEESASFYEDLVGQYEEIASFTDRKMFFAHPDITILKKRERP